MNIGYSFWGFLGNGVLDTPDGGRFHRLSFLKQIIKSGNEIYCLQKNRDLVEASQKIIEKKLHFSDSFPEIDILFLEYRWKIPGRNFNIAKYSPNYSPDYDRQQLLIRHYRKTGVPIIIWDKDQKLSNVPKGVNIVYVPSFITLKKQKRLLFPFDDKLISAINTKINSYDKSKKTNDLVYIGNQYEREKSFQEFINLPAKSFFTKTKVYGNWTKYPQKTQQNLIEFQNVSFEGKLPFQDINNIYEQSFSTVLIAPDRYYKTGQVTQRLFEAFSSLTLTFVPTMYRGVEDVFDEMLYVKDHHDVINKITLFRNMENKKLKKFLRNQLKKLSLYSLKKQVAVLLSDIEQIRKNYEKHLCEKN